MPVTMKANTEPVVYISVNGGKKVPVLVDTGSSGLVLTRDAVGAGDLGPATGTGTSGYSGGLTYDYTTTTRWSTSAAAQSPSPPRSTSSTPPTPRRSRTTWRLRVLSVSGCGRQHCRPGPEYPDDLVAW